MAKNVGAWNIRLAKGVKVKYASTLHFDAYEHECDECLGVSTYKWRSNFRLGKFRGHPGLTTSMPSKELCIGSFEAYK